MTAPPRSWPMPAVSRPIEGVGELLQWVCSGGSSIPVGMRSGSSATDGITRKRGSRLRSDATTSRRGATSAPVRSRVLRYQVGD